MSTSNIFIPVNQQESEAPKKVSLPPGAEKGRQYCLRISQVIISFALAVMPLLYIVNNINPTSFDRIMVASSLVALGVIFAAIALLFTKQATTVVPWAAVPLALLVVWGVVSAYATTDSYDAFWGAALEPLTVAFTLLLLVFTLVPLVLQSAPSMLSRAIVGIGGVAFLVVLHTVLRYWFGVSVLDFGELTSVNQSLVGNFNDSAIYAGFVVLAGLVSLLMLPLRLFAQTLIALIITLSLALLLLVNFSLVWHVMLFASALLTGYVLMRRSLFQQSPAAPITWLTKSMTIATFIIALVASLFGSAIAGSLNTMTNTEFVEVRPSFEGSMAITREVYEDSPLLGVGPNRFEDAWRQHKALDVNAGIFWDTDFSAGHSYVLSVFTTYGLVGGLLLVLFHLKFLWFGISRLAANVSNSTFARYTTTVTFVGAVFLWGMTYLYTPSGTLLLLAATLTGLTFAAGAALSGTRLLVVDVVTNRIRGFMALVTAALLIVLIGGFWSQMVDKYTVQMTLAGDIDSENDEVVALVADQRIADLNNLVATASPDSVTQEDLLAASEAALGASRKAVSLDPTNPNHYERLASLYSLLGAIGVTGGYDSAEETLRDAIEVDPKNPKHHLALARVLLANDEAEAAALALEKATELKFNYTPAIQLQAELAIANQETAAAIEQVQAITQLDPGNATRWYQLGLLYGAENNTEDAIRVLLRAVQIDPTYADARYLLALQYLADDRREAALTQLRRIESTNPNNEQLLSLITRVENDEPIEITDTTPDFNQVVPVVDSESAVSVPSGVPTDLFAPVNASGEETGS